MNSTEDSLEPWEMADYGWFSERLNRMRREEKKRQDMEELGVADDLSPDN